jgi:hypothetical protein
LETGWRVNRSTLKRVPLKAECFARGAPAPAVIARGGTSFWRAFCLTVLLISVGRPLKSLAQQQDVIDREPEIKAAYLYNFGRYVEWPVSATSVGASGSPDFVIGVVGDSPVVAPLRTIAASKKVGGRAILVRQFKAATDFQACQVLFVPAGQDPELVAAILKRARATPTLVVGEEEGFALKHGQIGFYTDQNNMKFEINVGSADKVGLKISSKLLSLGRIVGEKQGN